jgi:hypothetical protein
MRARPRAWRRTPAVGLLLEEGDEEAGVMGGGAARQRTDRLTNASDDL